jgi:hypothetical protein
MRSSALEHAVTEQMFGTEEQPADAISAVKALSKANAEGQRIYHITPENRNTTLPNIGHDAATMAEIRSALNAGKEVITHTSAVTVPGWSGAGYVILDPETGVGAWKIGGGKDGAILMVLGVSLILVLGVVALIFGSAGSLLFVFAYLEASLATFFQGLAFTLDALGIDASFACTMFFGATAAVIGTLVTTYTPLVVGAIIFDQAYDAITSRLTCI